ncbi:MAG: glycosyltransferase family 39 protein [Pseudomonadota bacterium]
MTDTTEARYAEIARMMLETGNWITPQYDYDVPFWGKPPLHTWASAAGMMFFGIGEFGARLPVVFISAGVMWAVFTFTRRHLGTDQALMCSAVLLSSFLFFGASAFVMTDIALALGTTICMCAFYTAVNTNGQNNTWQVLFFAGLAIGLLAKGPVALVLTAIPLVIWVLIGGRWAQLRKIQWGKGFFLTALASLPWYLAAEWATPGFLRYFLVGEHFERFIVSDWQGDLYGSGHARPKGIIWLYACAAFLPWIFFALALLRHYRSVALAIIDDMRGWYSYLFLWAISPMILFTPAANVLPAYVLPGIPAASILLVSLWSGAQRGVGRGARYMFVGAIGVTGACYMCIALLLVYIPEKLNLRTEKFLVAQVHRIDPDAHLTYLGKRIYSAEFYTAGQVSFVNELSKVDDLLTNARVDAVAIPKRLLPELHGVLADQFASAGMFRDKLLFVEQARPESSQ